MRYRRVLSCGLSLSLFLTVVLLPSRPLEVWPGAQTEAASRPPVRGKQGMVSSVSEIASQVGVDILKRGGNAVDAAVAVGLALAVVDRKSVV